MSQPRMILLEVNSTPENDKYLKSSMISNLVKPFSTRAAWLATLGLSCLSTIPLTGKLLFNLMDSAHNPSSFNEAKKNGMGILAIPLVCVASAFSTILPSILGGRLARGIVLPIIPIYSSNIANVKSTCEQFPKEYIKKIRGNHGMIIDSADIPFNTNAKVNRYRIVFHPAADMYQLSYELIKHENSILECNTRLFNYPGITENNPPGSSIDFVNAGIAQVYDIAKQMRWTNADLEKHLHFYGYCFGGSVGLRVAAYFKEKHGIDFCVFVDRSFGTYSDAMAGAIHANSGIPLPLAKAIAVTFLYAGGDLDFDSIESIKKLNPQCVHYINVNTETPNAPETAIDQVRNFLGIGSIDKGDGILLNNATLTAALEREGIRCGQQTSDILAGLGIQNHLANSELKMGHFGGLNTLSKAVDYYQNVVRAHEQKSHPQEERVTKTLNL